MSIYLPFKRRNMTAIARPLMPPFHNCPPPSRHMFRGKWMTVPEIAAAKGVSMSTVLRRLHAGLDLDMPRQKPGPKRRRYEFRGELTTVHQIAALTGWSRTKVRSRISGNCVLEGDELTMTRLLQDSVVLLTFNGETDTLAGWAERLGINDATLRNRINRGWAVMRALTEPAMRPHARKRYRRNAEIIRRMLEGFRSPASTGGYVENFTDATGTGVGRHETHFEGTSA